MGVVILPSPPRGRTMLGDTGVAVHPDDERYKDFNGKNVVLPIVGVLSRLLRMNMPTLKKARARVKLHRRMTLMTLKSASAVGWPR